MLEETNIKPNRILNILGVTSLEMNAPNTVPGIANNPNFRPTWYSILFCLEYEIVDAAALLNAANKLLLAASDGPNPANVKTGTTMMPPPSPIMEPSSPATNPNGTSHNSSNIVNVKMEHSIL